MKFINLIIGGVEIPFEASHAINQQYIPQEASNILTFSDGSSAKQTAWSGKTKIVTSGTGHIPLALSAIDFSAAVTMDCVDPIVINSASNIIALPAIRRTDVSSIGYAVVNGRAIKTSISVIGDTATLTPVPDATAYQALYFPRFTVLLKTRPTQSSSTRTLNSRSWSFEAVES